MIGITTIVTATYNKEKFLPQAAESVFNQTRKDWRWWIILDGANGKTTDYIFNLQHRDPRITAFMENVGFYERKKIYRPSILMNKYFPIIATDYFCWLSDDDIMQPTYLESLAGTLDSHPSWDVVFGWMDVIDQVNDTDWKLHMYFGRHHWNKEYNADTPPMHLLDGGQILQTKASYAVLNWQFPLEWVPGNTCDGLYLNELAKKFTLHPINEHVLTHRRTFLSENTSVDIGVKNEN
jgi:glycosyltransferase involved in cell wall biosynthesis